MKKSLFLLPLMAMFVSCIQTPQLPKVEYKTMTVAKQNVDIHLRCAASLKGIQDVDIIPQATGNLMEIKVKAGDNVKKGQTLFIIDQVPSLAELRVAEANLKVAKAQAATSKINLESKKDLRSKNIVSDIQVQRAENEYATALATIDQAEASVTNAKQTLSYTVVTAPCDGVVGSINFKIGALVGPSAGPMTTVSNNQQIRATASLTEADLLNFSNEHEGNLDDLLKKFPKLKLITSIGTYFDEEGTVESISGVINKSTGTMPVEIIFPNPKGILRSGGAAQIEIPLTYEDVIVIPQAATYQLQNKYFAYKVVDNKAHGVEVTVYPMDNGRDYIVKSGLNPGDVIIAAGAGNVKEGEEVSYQMTL